MASHYQGQAKEELALNCLISLSRAADSVRKASTEHLLAADLTGSQFGVLEMLLHLGPLSQREIAQKHLKSAGNITHVIDNLEKSGLVERITDPEDRRANRVQLTTKGHTKIVSVFKDHVQEVVGIFDILNVEEQTQLRSLCKKLGLANKNI